MANKPIFIGLAFPYAKGAYGIPETIIDEDLVKSDLFMLLNTRRGERIMLPEYGLDVERFLFDNTGPLLRAKIYREVITTIANNEPRVSIISIDIEEDKTLVDIKVTYQINGLVDSLTLTKSREGI